MPEVFTFPLKTTLTAAIVSATRPVTFTVAATDALLGASGAIFSCLIYDFGTDTNPTNAEALQITAGGGTLSWTGTTESGSAALTHANGSTVLATVFTPRSISQPLTDHITPATTPDPHSAYVRKTSYLAKGDLLVGASSGAFSSLPVSNIDGVSLVSSSTSPLGIAWSAGGSGSQQAVALTATALLTAIPGGSSLAAVARITTTTAGIVGAATTQVLTQAVDGLSTFTFNSIGTYKRLQITGSCRSTVNALLDALRLTINGDLNKNYTTQSITTAASVISTSAIDVQTTSMSLADVPGILAGQEIPLTISIDIPNPTNQSFAKGILANMNLITTNGGLPTLKIMLRYGIWSPTQPVPINSITFTLASGVFANGSVFTLWGFA